MGQEVQVLEAFLELLNRAETEWPTLCEEIKKAEAEMQDLIHEIELTNFNACEVIFYQGKFKK